MTTHPVECLCGHGFEVPKSLIGGLANCPKCGKATPVEGLNDPLWHMLRFAGVAVWAVATFVAYGQGGMGPALVVCGITALVLLLVRIAF